MKKKVILLGLFLLVSFLIIFMTEESYWRSYMQEYALRSMNNDLKYLKLFNDKDYINLKKELVDEKKELEKLNLYFFFRKCINLEKVFISSIDNIKSQKIADYEKQLQLLKDKNYTKLKWSFWVNLSGNEEMHFFFLFRDKKIKSFVNIIIWEKNISILKDEFKNTFFEKYILNKDNTFLLGSKRLHFRYEKDKYIRCSLEDKSGNIINKVNYTFLENQTVNKIVYLKSDNNGSYLRLYDFSKRSTKKTFFNKTD